ncbi:hypothetical protein Pvag_pPag30266 (plasmid) [Pantoea vagans C9-1]|nr:hypothetical protein Pvag_pPag30266 [Pantoea vagans C9-1]
MTRKEALNSEHPAGLSGYYHNSYHYHLIINSMLKIR